MVLWPPRSSDLTPVEPSEGHTSSLLDKRGNMQAEIWLLVEGCKTMQHIPGTSQHIQKSWRYRTEPSNFSNFSAITLTTAKRFYAEV